MITFRQSATSAAPSFAARIRRPDAPRPARGGRRDVVRRVPRTNTRPAPARCGSATGSAPTPSARPPGSARRPATTRPRSPSATGSARRRPRRQRTGRGADRDALRPGHRGRDDRVPPASVPASGTATFIRGTDGARAEWAMGWSDDPTQSALRAVIALRQPAGGGLSQALSAAGAARSACRPSAPACRRSPSAAGSPAGPARAGTCAAAGA